MLITYKPPVTNPPKSSQTGPNARKCQYITFLLKKIRGEAQTPPPTPQEWRLPVMLALLAGEHSSECGISSNLNINLQANRACWDFNGLPLMTRFPLFCKLNCCTTFFNKVIYMPIGPMGCWAERLMQKSYMETPVCYCTGQHNIGFHGFPQNVFTLNFGKIRGFP